MNRPSSLLLALTSCAALSAPLSNAQAPLGYTITYVTGNGTAGFAGDGSDANAAQINNPSALALDSAGNLFIADQLNSRVRKVSGTTISTVAGSDKVGYFGDTGQATAAGIGYPLGLAVDAQGNIYIADAPNHGVRKVTSAGIISTVAGGQLAAFGGDGAKAINAFINFPSGIAVDAAGNFYFSDTGNQRIRKVTTDGTITTVSGNGTIGVSDGPAASATFNSPAGLALDSAGNLYIADKDNGMIRKLSPDGVLTTIAGTGVNGFSGDGGPATSAMLNHPRGVSVGSDGTIYVADTLNSRVRAIAKNGTISTIAGNSYVGDSDGGGIATQAILKFPDAVVAASGGRVYVADTQNNRIRLLTPIAPATPPGPPVISSGGVVTAAAFGAAPATAPGSWIEIYGSNLAGNTRQWTAQEFNGIHAPSSLDNVKVTIGGQPAFVSFISPGQVNAQVPNVGTGPQQVIVTTSAGSSAPATITVNPAQPGLLSPPSFRSASRQYVAALLADGRTYALPVATIPGVPSRPARPGETLTLFGVGFGAVDPDLTPGDITQGLANLKVAPKILFGQSEATISYAGLVPGAVGLYQFNVVVPNVPDNDATPISVNLGGVTSGQTLVIPVRR